MRNSIFLALAILVACDGVETKDAGGIGDTDVSADTDTDTDADADTDSDTDTDTDIEVQEAPIALDDFEACDEGGDAIIEGLLNDTDVNGDIDPNTVVVVDEPLVGQVTVRPDGSFGYLHDGTEDVSDSFTYTVSDLLGNISNIATVDLTINPINDPPTAFDDVAVTDEGGAVFIDVAVNDTDPDDGVDVTSAVVVTQPLHGTATVLPTGEIDYVHDGSEDPSDTLTYTISDLAGATSNAATVQITLNPINDDPIANDDNCNAQPGLMGICRVSNNDFDPDDGLDLTSIIVTVQPLWGTLVVQLDGTVDYTHDNSPNYSDTWSYTIADNSGVVSNEATVNMTIADLVLQTLDMTPADGNLIETDDPLYANKGYEFTATQDFDIEGGAWWITLPVGGYVSLSIYDAGGVLLARGTQGMGQNLGLEEWYQSDLQFSFIAGQTYTASFYTNYAASSTFDRQDGPTYGYAVDGMIENLTHRSSSVSGDFASEEWPDYFGNTWAPHQRLDVWVAP